MVDADGQDGGNADSGFVRPSGLSDGFADREPLPVQTSTAPAPSGEEVAAFGRPPGGGEFAPLPGERIPPRHGVSSAAEQPGSAQVFGRSASGANGFDPAPGTRIEPTGGPPESPWWKADAHRDPWRDPRSPAWLGQPAMFQRGQPEQLDPEQDVETEFDDLPEVPEPEAEPQTIVVQRKLTRLGLVLSVAIALIAGAVGGGVGYWLSQRTKTVLHNPDAKLGKIDQPANRPPGSVAAIAAAITPAVVSIVVRTSATEGVGSGVVIDSAGDILTNNHVISAAADGSGSIVVSFANQESTSATIVGRDPESDLAVVRVQHSGLTVAPLGDSNLLAIGDPVIAVGSPLGLSETVTSGIVSALHRPVPVSGDGSDTNAVIDAIQTDAAINPGNSGGALVDAAGAVVGINSALASSQAGGTGQAGSVGIGFAIPIDYARGIAQQLIRTGKAVHASLGLVGSSANDQSVLTGALVQQVTPGGPADNAGIKPGDVITLADSTLITSYPQLIVVLQRHQPGDTISVRYYRGGQERTVSVKLGSG